MFKKINISDNLKNNQNYILGKKQYNFIYSKIISEFLEVKLIDFIVNWFYKFISCMFLGIITGIILGAFLLSLLSIYLKISLFSLFVYYIIFYFLFFFICSFIISFIKEMNIEKKYYINYRVIKKSPIIFSIKDQIKNYFNFKSFTELKYFANFYFFLFFYLVFIIYFLVSSINIHFSNTLNIFIFLGFLFGPLLFLILFLLIFYLFKYLYFFIIFGNSFVSKNNNRLYIAKIGKIDFSNLKLMNYKIFNDYLLLDIEKFLEKNEKKFIVLKKIGVFFNTIEKILNIINKK